MPTATESGYDVPVAQYRAVAAPNGTPQEVKDRLVEAFDAAVATDAYQQFNEQNMLTPHEISGEEVEQEWTELAERYEQLVEEYDISLAE